MELFCPVSRYQVNERVVRINGLIILILLSLSLFIPFEWILFFLIFDFAIKVFFGLKKSPVSQLAQLLFKLSGHKPKRINAGPKVFASQTGLAMCIAIVVLELLGFNLLAVIVLSTLILFVSLECFFGFCTACYLLTFLSRLKKTMG